MAPPTNNRRGKESASGSGNQNQNTTASATSSSSNKKEQLKWAYMMVDMPLKQLVDKRLIEKVRKCVDAKFYPFDKFYSRATLSYGPVQMAFLDMGWGGEEMEKAYKRAKGTHAVIELMMDRVSDNRERSKNRCRKRFEGT